MVLLRFFLVSAALSLVPGLPTQKIGSKTDDGIKAAGVPQKTEDGKKGEEPLEMTEVRFTDESVVRMAILQDRLEIVTKYGKLTVPTSDIMKIDFGVHVPPDLDKKITQAIDDLGSENYKAREVAVRDLVIWGPYAYPQLFKAAKSTQLEVSKRAVMAIEKLKAKHPARNLRTREEDIVVTPTITVVGRIITPTVKAKAENFGELDLQLTKLRSIRWLTTAQEVEVTLDAARYANQNQWMDTNLEVQQGTRLQIDATGNVNLWPQNGGFICGPSGNFNGNKAPGLPFNPGALIGRIGDSGQMFLIGDHYTGTASREGKLYLHIAPSPWVPNGSIGSYTVKITPKGEFGGD